MNYNELTNEQRRQLIDCKQLFDAYVRARDRWNHSYTGSMRWVTRKGHDYLHHKRGLREESLGPRTPETEATYAAFLSGRAKQTQELSQLSARLDTMAPVNRALNIGRVPRLTAKIVRRLDDENLLGNHIIVVGTNALFAYEARAGILFFSELLATNDADLLWDSRQSLKVLVRNKGAKSILGLLQKVDPSFAAERQGSFRALNSDGFAVDLIRPEDGSLLQARDRSVVGDDPDDLHGSPIFGLRWLLNSPRFEEIVIGEDGYPLRMIVPDPRAFALHKIWISDQKQREALKRRRDQTQALSVVDIAQTYLSLSFESRDLEALPARLRHLIPVKNEQTPSMTPKW